MEVEVSCPKYASECVKSASIVATTFAGFSRNMRQNYVWWCTRYRSADQQNRTLARLHVCLYASLAYLMWSAVSCAYTRARHNAFAARQDGPNHGCLRTTSLFAGSLRMRPWIGVPPIGCPNNSLNLSWIPCSNAVNKRDPAESCAAVSSLPV